MIYSLQSDPTVWFNCVSLRTEWWPVNFSELVASSNCILRVLFCQLCSATFHSAYTDQVLFLDCIQWLYSVVVFSDCVQRLKNNATSNWMCFLSLSTQSALISEIENLPKALPCSSNVIFWKWFLVASSLQKRWMASDGEFHRRNEFVAIACRSLRINTPKLGD